MMIPEGYLAEGSTMHIFGPSQRVTGSHSYSSPSSLESAKFWHCPAVGVARYTRPLRLGDGWHFFDVCSTANCSVFVVALAAPLGNGPSRGCPRRSVGWGAGGSWWSWCSGCFMKSIYEWKNTLKKHTHIHSHGDAHVHSMHMHAPQTHAVMQQFVQSFAALISMLFRFGQTHWTP